MLLSTITKLASTQANDIALKTQSSAISYQALNAHVVESASALAKWPESTRLALAIDNSPAWIIIDIAALALGMPNIPLPAFFSDQQLLHAVLDSGANLLVTDNPAHFEAIFADVITHSVNLEVAGSALTALSLNITKKALPAKTVKITYTSGTTGSPKGVCLSQEAMLAVAKNIQTSVGVNAQDQHLCVLPLSTLLENVAGIYATLLGGGCVHVYPSESIGFSGTGLDISLLSQAIEQSQTSTAILIPELLKALTLHYSANRQVPSSLKFLAVGGAHVAQQLLADAQQLGLPVFEGYGLSESASVVTLNTPNANRMGSVGKALPHMEIKLAPDQEILIKGANLLGYTEQAAGIDEEGYVHTGDVGYCDDGYWYISGRKKNIFITSYGRNVSPEWVEAELTQLPSIRQACLFGEARPFNTALIVCAAQVEDATINEEINLVNLKLPEYAHIKQWLRAKAAFSTSNQQLTPNGRLKRDAIWTSYQTEINAIY